MQLGFVHWVIAGVLLAILGMVIFNQYHLLASKGRRSRCLQRQRIIEDCVALWGRTHTPFPEGTRGYACFTRRDGNIFKTDGFPTGFTGDALADCGNIQPWVCPQSLTEDFHDDPSAVPDDDGPDGFGNYCYVQDDKGTSLPPLPELVGSYPPVRSAVCAVYGGKNHVGADGRVGSRHSDRW